MTMSAPALSFPPRPLSPVETAVLAGLQASPKQLPPWLFYDDAGSELFEQITALPEYYPTRTERAILAGAAEAIVDLAGAPAALVELGAGSASKTELLLVEALRRHERISYHPIDVSAAALAESCARLGARYPRLALGPLQARYPEQLGCLDAIPGPRLVLFLGSNVGNYDPPAARALLAALGRHLRADDALILGVDLRKAPEVLLPAYDDAAGVTAAFNKNVLRRLNRELGAAFDPDRFRHVAAWNDAASRVEMHLEALEAQEIPIASLGLRLALERGERIHTESSYKPTQEAVDGLLAASGFVREARWCDERGWFSVNLARPIPPG